KTATLALTNATLPYIRKLAKSGSLNAIKSNLSLRLGLNVFNGVLTNSAIAKIHNFEFKELSDAIKQ
ncbi:MAG: alanine dehydrogenase, partial [Campylobacterota bacterium]|nr:alanine dehydrogenase [Campylobacterota bacterium]